jgi:hypothetical protein
VRERECVCVCAHYVCVCVCASVYKQSSTPSLTSACLTPVTNVKFLQEILAFPGRTSCWAIYLTCTFMPPTTLPSPSLQSGEGMGRLSHTMCRRMAGKLFLHPKKTCMYLLLPQEEVYICSSRLGLIKMDHRHSGNGRNSQQ